MVDDRRASDIGTAGGVSGGSTAGTPNVFTQMFIGVLAEADTTAFAEWQKIPVWRRRAALASFVLGTFGLGFTLGGLVFGRWSRADFDRNLDTYERRRRY